MKIRSFILVTFIAACMPVVGWSEDQNPAFAGLTLMVPDPATTVAYQWIGATEDSSNGWHVDTYQSNNGILTISGPASSGLGKVEGAAYGYVQNGTFYKDGYSSRYSANSLPNDLRPPVQFGDNNYHLYPHQKLRISFHGWQKILCQERRVFTPHNQERTSRLTMIAGRGSNKIFSHLGIPCLKRIEIP